MYGDKRDYPKIDIFVNGKYVGSTTWSKTLKEAALKYQERHGIALSAIKCVRDNHD